MSIFKKYFAKTKLAFSPVDPLGDGLREMIERAKQSPSAIRLDEEEDLTNNNIWDNVEIKESSDTVD